MNKWSRICTLAGCVILLAAVFAFGFYELHRRNTRSGNQVEQASPEDAFTEYSFVSQHDDGSCVNVNVYAYDNNLYLSEAYADVGKQWAYHHVKFDSEQSKLWYSKVMNPTMAENDHSLASSYEIANLFFATDDGDMSYDVTPIDLSDFGYIDPWKERMTTVGDLPKYCEVFAMEPIRALLGFDGDARENAYVDSIYAQMAKIMYPDESGATDLAKYSFESITLDSVMDDGYMLNLSSKDGDYSFFVTMEGYVLGQK